MSTTVAEPTTVKMPKKDVSTWKGVVEIAKGGPFSASQISAAWNTPCPDDDKILEDLNRGVFDTPDKLFEAHEKAKGAPAKNQIASRYCEMVLAEEAAKL